nr:hypothetical protein [Tanacetum cinerariifolium]
MSKYSTSRSPTSSSFVWESSSVLTISINVMPLPSPLVHIISVLDNWETNSINSKNELSLRTFSVMNKINGSGDSLCYLGWIVTALIEHGHGLILTGLQLGFFGVLVMKLTTSRLVNGSSCEGIDMVIKNLDLEPKDIILEFYSPSRWKELSKETSSKILARSDGSY